MNASNSRKKKKRNLIKMWGISMEEINTHFTLCVDKDRRNLRGMVVQAEVLKYGN